MSITAIICVFFLILYAVFYLHDLLAPKIVIEMFDFEIQDVLITIAITFLLVYYNII